MTPRRADPADVPALARFRAEGWARVHLGLVPPKPAAKADFLRRPENFGEGLRVIGPTGATGPCAAAGDGLDRTGVAPELQGTGAAEVPARDAEVRLRAAGFCRAVAERAARNRTRPSPRKGESRGLDVRHSAPVGSGPRVRPGSARASGGGSEFGPQAADKGNARAAAFYARMGWRRRGIEPIAVDSAAGPFPPGRILFWRDLS